VRLRRRAEELGVKVIDGVVKDVEVRQGYLNQVLYVPEDGDRVSLDAPLDRRCQADETGYWRTSSELKRTSRYQRSSFWFRLEGFDRNILKQMKEVKNPASLLRPVFRYPPLSREAQLDLGDSRCGPKMAKISSASGSSIVQISIRARVASVEDFLANVGGRASRRRKDWSKSGRIVDTNVFRNYFYETERSYSRDGWFIIGGRRADTVDPLYSTGIATTSLQVKQVCSPDRSRQEGYAD